MSGNSSLSSASTSPIDRCSASRALIGTVLTLIAPDEEHEHEAADLEVGEVVQRRGVDPLVVDVGAVERPDVGHLVAAVDPAHRGVAAGHGDVVEEDVGVGVAPEGGDLAVEHEAAAGVGPAPHDQHAHALGQLGQRRAELLVELQALGELGEAQGGFVLVGQRATARGAEVGPGLVLVAAPAASHARRRYPGRPDRGDGHPRRAVDVRRLGLDWRSTVRSKVRSRVVAKPSTSASSHRCGGRSGAPSSSHRDRDAGADRRRHGRRHRDASGSRSVSSNGEPVEQDRAVLEHRAPAPHLGRAAQLAVPDPQVGALLLGEAHRPRGAPSWRAMRAPSTPSRASPAIERAGQQPVDGVDATRPRPRAAGIATA